MKKLAFAFIASLISLAAPAMADTSCTTLKGLSGEYCPVKAKRSQMAKLLDQGCVQIARDGIVVQTPYCPAAMFQATAVVASIAPTYEGSDNDDNGGVGGNDGSAGGDKEAGGVSSDSGDSGDSGDSEAGGTAGGDGGSAGGDKEAGGVL